MAALIELVIVLAVLLALASLVFRGARGVRPAERRSFAVTDAVDATPPVIRRGPWQARYVLEGGTTVWTIVRTVTDGRGEHEEVHEIVRIDSAATDFEALFVAGERRAQERALLLNSSLSP